MKWVIVTNESGNMGKDNGMKRVTLVNLYDAWRYIPLACGYLQTYACRIPKIRDTHEFEIYCVSNKKPRAEILEELKERDSEIYAFSCYCWNTTQVKALLQSLLKEKKGVNCIIGGPQVENCGEKYLIDKYENLVLCNGEGEKVFSNYLLELTKKQPDLSNVRGLSFYKEKVLVTTDSEEPIMNLDEIPSPFLNGIFNVDHYNAVVLEASRGCPFSCHFCCWKQTTRVRKFSESRIHKEIEWLSEHECKVLHITDGNFGMFKRDISISKHIIACRNKYKYPLAVWWSPSKTQPERVLQIGRILQEGGLISPIILALQSLSPRVGKEINRTNMSLQDYARILKHISDTGLDSYTELIWPLPEETLHTFKETIEKMCELQADYVTYPLMLLNNTVLYREVGKYEIITYKEGDEDYSFVIQNKYVNHLEWVEGLNLFRVCVMLNSLRMLYCTGYYLHHGGCLSYTQLFSDFLEYHQDHPNPLVTKIINIGSNMLSYKQARWKVCHDERENIEEYVNNFVTSQEWWGDEDAQMLYEIDLLNKPYIYENTPIKRKKHTFRYLKIHDIDYSGYVVEVPHKALSYMFRIGLINTQDRKWNNIFHVKHKVNTVDEEMDKDDFSSFFLTYYSMRRFSPHWQSTNIA